MHPPRKLGKSLLALAAGCSVACSFGAAAQAGPATQNPAQQVILYLTNRERVAQGLSPLRWSPELTAAAYAHCSAMVRANELSHHLAGEPDLAERAAREGSRFHAVAENIAYGVSPASIEAQWMHSPPHRENILNPAMDSIGMSLLLSRGTLWAVEDFAASTPNLDSSAVQRLIAGQLRSQQLSVAASGSEEQKAADAACTRDSGKGGSAARFAMRWETADLHALPPDLAEAIESGRYSYAAVAVCPAQNPSNRNFTAYRLAVLLF